MGSYLRQLGQPTIWLHLDAGDTDLASFFHYLKAAARALAGKTAERIPVLRPEYQQDPAAFARGAFAELFALLPPGTVIALDNYESIAEHSELHEALAAAIEKSPVGMRWYIASRNRPLVAFTRLRLDRLKELTWQELHFTLEETAELSKRRNRRQPLDEADLSRLQDLTQGWAAGVVLLLESGPILTQQAERFLLEDSKPVFDYFAAEVFNRLPSLHQEVLLKTALLPQVDAEAAKGLTGVASAASILEEMVERNYFAVRYSNRASSFRFHPLFRSFLLGRGRRVLAEEERVQLSLHAAQLLERDGQVEAAAELLNDAGQWEVLADLVLRSAEALISQGRHHLVAQWIAAIPPAAKQRHEAWLTYWLGAARLPFELEVARTHHERAFLLFQQQSEPSSKRVEGLFLSWSGVVEAALFSWSSLTQLDPWIDALEQLLLIHKPPNLRVDARVTALIHGALIFRRPDSAAVQVWEKRLRRFLLAARFLDVDNYVLLANNLFHHALWTGKLTRAMELLATLEKIVESRRVGPASKGCWYTMRAVASLFTGNYSDGLRAVEDGVQHLRATGVTFWEPILLSQGAFASVAARNLEQAETYLEQMQQALRPDQPNGALLYHDASAQLALARGQLAEADEHARLAVDHAVRIAAIFPEAGVRIGRGHTLCALGRYEAAQEQFELAIALARQMKSTCIEARSLLGLGYLRLKQGKAAVGLETLAEGLSLSARYAYRTHVWWIPDVFAVICEAALTASIEVDYVRELVRCRAVLPANERVLEYGWPVPVRVECLGAVRMTLHEKPIEFSRKAQLRPLELLLAIIALGGERVSEARLAAALWPDSDGDAANQALSTTLHRLRKLIGNDVVLRREQCLTLNQSACWVDALACDRIWAALDAQELEELLWSLDRYRGQFLSGMDAPWAVVFRERLSSRFGRAACEGSRRLQATREWSRATEVLERALDVEPTAEPLYRELIGLLRQRGREAEAVAVYDRCRRTLRATFDVDPSPETAELVGRA